MVNENNSSELIIRPDYDIQLRAFEEGLLNFVHGYGFPTENVFVPVSERMDIFNNFGNAITTLNSDKRKHSWYISKFIAAIATGLFDAALNYLWDETVSELRQRIAGYDLSYFFDNAVKNLEKRKEFNTEKDLEKLNDEDLIRGAREIELISDLGHRHLQFIRDMRNHASAAHPNQNEITGLLLVGWLQTCIREVISLPEPHIATKIKTLLARIKTDNITGIAAEQIATTFDHLTTEQVNTLASGFFGIYTRLDTLPQTRENIHRLLPHLWIFVDESTRQQFGMKYAQYIVNDEKEAKLARQFLEIVSAISYIPDNLRAIEIKNAVDNLLNAHSGFGNFYNEPSFARALQRLVGEVGTIPAQVNNPYVLGLVTVFLTNGHGVAHNAEDIYYSLINLFDARQALIAIISFRDINISSKLQFKLCQEKYRELLGLMKMKISSNAVKDLINDIENYKGPLYDMKDAFKQKLANLQKIMKI